MSRYDESREVGDIVYPAYTPQRLGKVVEVVAERPEPWGRLLRVKWADGTVDQRDAFKVLRLDDLIADHQKKLAGHIKRRDKAEREIEI